MYPCTGSDAFAVDACHDNKTEVKLTLLAIKFPGALGATGTGVVGGGGGGDDGGGGEVGGGGGGDDDTGGGGAGVLPTGASDKNMSDVGADGPCAFVARNVNVYSVASARPVSTAPVLSGVMIGSGNDAAGDKVAT